MINNNINTYQSVADYNNDQTRMYPNISYIQATDEVKWVGEDPLLIVKYNVTNTSSPTQLSATYYYVLNKFNKQIIDGVEQQSVVASYQFDTTGEHVVKYGLINNAILNKSTFYNIQNITEVQMPSTITLIEESAFSNCTNLTSVKLSKGLISVEKNIFANCSSLTNVVLPETLTVIGEGMLRQTAITNITIPNSVTSIGNMAFLSCNSLTTVIIGTGVTEIGSSAFQNCMSITNFTIYATTPPTLGTNALLSVSSNIYVPAESVNAYKTASGWSDFASYIQAIPTT